MCFNFSVGVFYLNYGSQPKYVSILVMLIVSLATGMNIHFRFYAFVNGILGDESLLLNLKKQGEKLFIYLFFFSCRFP